MSGWTKVKEIFARETNSVSVTAKLGVAVDTETEAYKQGFDKDKGKEEDDAMATSIAEKTITLITKGTK